MKRREDIKVLRGTARFEHLQAQVIARSEADNWLEARREWVVTDHDTSHDEICMCTNTGLVHVFTIRNKLNGNEMRPIGSVCVHHFEMEDMSAEVKRRLAEVERERRRVAKWGETVTPKGWFGGKRYKELPSAYLKYLATLERPAAHLADMLAYARAAASKK
jgi:hypothetical protein